MLGSKRNKELQGQIEDFMNLVRSGIDTYQNAVTHFLNQGNDEHFQILIEQVHQAESAADDVRHRVAIALYEHALLPESRGDLLTLLEQIDRIPNQAEGVLYRIETQGLQIPSFLQPDLTEMTNLTVQTVGILIDGVNSALHLKPDLGEFARWIDNNESLCDQLERKMIREVFRGDLDACARILLKELIEEMAAITDLCENISHYITIFHIKHRI